MTADLWNPTRGQSYTLVWFWFRSHLFVNFILTKMQYSSDQNIHQSFTSCLRFRALLWATNPNNSTVWTNVELNLCCWVCLCALERRIFWATMLYFQTWLCCFILKINIHPCTLRITFPSLTVDIYINEGNFCRFYFFIYSFYKKPTS